MPEREYDSRLPTWARAEIVQLVLAYFVVVVGVCLAFAVLFLLGISATQVIIAPVTGLASVVLGFYFGSSGVELAKRDARNASRAATELDDTAAGYRLEYETMQSNIKNEYAALLAWLASDKKLRESFKQFATSYVFESGTSPN